MAQVNIRLSTGHSHVWQFGKRWQESPEGKDIIARFWRNVQKTPDGCWIWSGNVASHGYGRLGVPGRTQIRAHRLSWLIHRGDIPEHLTVCHSCDVPACVNPAHLRLDSQKGNLRESVRKGRKRTWGLQRLDAEQVLAIRAAVAGGALHREVAATFGVSRNHISTIINRKVWAHLDNVSECGTTPVHEAGERGEQTPLLNDARRLVG